jgi:predicted dehydrogenase
MKQAVTPQRYGMAGAGRQSGYLLDAIIMLLTESGCDVSAIADTRLGAAEQRAREFDIPGVYAGPMGFHRMVDAEALDGVIIVTPHETHAGLAISAMQRGLDVFVEKPVADSLERAREMVNVAERLGRTLGTGYLYNAWAPWLTQQASTAIGSFMGARATWSRADGVQGEEFCRDPNGGVLRDLFGHMYTAADRLLAAAPVAVRATGSREATVRCHGPEFQGWDTVRAEIECADGSTVKVDTSWADGGPADEEIRLDVFGNAGQVEFLFPGPRQDAAALKPVLRPRGGEATFGPAPDLYSTVAARHLGNWHRARQGLEPLAFTARDALRVESVISATAEALRTGERVAVPDWRAPSAA